MNALILASLSNPRAVTVGMLTLVLLGCLCVAQIPIDILPVFKSPAVQVLTFYGGMPAANIEKDITSRMERWTGQAAGTKRQESRSIVGASIIRNYYQDDIDPNGALSQVMSLATAAIPNLPPGTLPPVVLPFDPTSTVPACLVALDSDSQDPRLEALLYDVARYEVRNFIMSSPGAVAPVVYGGKIRAVIAYLDRDKLQVRNLSPLDAMRAIDDYNVFLPTGDAKIGDLDYAIDSNSMFEDVDHMKGIPLRSRFENAAYLGDVAVPEDSAFIQTNVVRVNGKKQVYIPVFRQLGSSTLAVVDNLARNLPGYQARLSRNDVRLKLVMDQSVYVKHSIKSLFFEGLLGAVLCSLVILAFLGELRMTAIAAMTIPVSVLAAIACLYYTGNTINVMTLAGLSLAIGPMVDSAIICLENTHRHLDMGATPHDAAFRGASEVAMPELVASLCTLLTLSPLAMMPGLGRFLFRPMALAVAFAMIIAYVLSRSFVPARCAGWLKPHGVRGEDHVRGASHCSDDAAETDHVHAPPAKGLFARWELLIDVGVRWYTRRLRNVMNHRLLTLAIAFAAFVAVVIGLGSQLKREFFPEVDSGAFEIAVRVKKTGTRIERTEDKIKRVEGKVIEVLGGYAKRDARAEHGADEHAEGGDLDTIISELGVTPDWSAAYTPNAGPMDVIVKVQLTPERRESAQEYVHELRAAFAEPEFDDLEFSFDAGGMIRGAMNEGKSTPINIRVEGKDLETSHQVAKAIQEKVVEVDGVVDCRIMQRLDYPRFMIEVNRKKAADAGLTQNDVMENVVAALNSSIQFNKKNFWIDPKSHNQYFVGVSYFEKDIVSQETVLNIPITGRHEGQPIPLSNVAEIEEGEVPAEVTHIDLAPAIDLVMGVDGRDLGHVADDVYHVVAQFGEPRPGERGVWNPYDPKPNPDERAKNGQDGGRKTIDGAKLVLSGEYSRMKDTFVSLGIGSTVSVTLIYFLMVALFRSYLTPLVVISAVPIGVVGVVIVLYLTGTPINVQSILGVIFMVGIVVSNTVLLTDFAQHIRDDEHLSPTVAIAKAASIRVRPVVMTALATFFALMPMAMALERGSEANAPLGRAVIGGLLAGLITTLFVVPCLYSLVVPDDSESKKAAAEHA